MMTSAQIIDLACQIAKAPGYKSQAALFMNSRLLQIALQQDLDIVKRFYTFNTSIGQELYPLPANYLRARQVFYYNNGVAYDLDQRSIEEYNRLFQGPGLDDYPYLFATDISGSLSGNAPIPQLYLYPQPIVELQIEILYFDKSVEVTDPANSETIPWFQDQLLLVKDIAAQLMAITDDTRADASLAGVDKMFTSYLQMANDKEQRVQKVSLDTDNFRTARRSVRPTKLQGD